jgi:hypothetical protein|tara:strand:- start:357 stop:986 length:630 start_codon:yes stop_codon:yes gene_type:complete
MFKKNYCNKCEGKLKDSYSYCPYCGLDLRNPEKDMRDFGVIGKNNLEGTPLVGGGGTGFGITDKMISSVMNSLIKNLGKQFDNMDSQNVKSSPKGIQIRFGAPPKSAQQKKKEIIEKEITSEQIKRMSKLPRSEAKTNVRRFSDKVVYDLKASGIEDVKDIFVSKLESGYEIKAIGKTKVYVNSIPVNLPLKKYSLSKSGMSVEFGLSN